MLHFNLNGANKTMLELLKHEETRREGAYGNDDMRTDCNSAESWVWSAYLEADYTLIYNDVIYWVRESKNQKSYEAWAKDRVNELRNFLDANLYPFRAEVIGEPRVNCTDALEVTIRLRSKMVEWHDADFDNARNLAQAAIYVAAEILETPKSYFPRRIGRKAYGWKHINNDMFVALADEIIETE